MHDSKFHFSDTVLYNVLPNFFLYFDNIGDESCKVLLSTCSLNELEKFIKVAGGGLAEDVEEGDYSGLVGVSYL